MSFQSPLSVSSQALAELLEDSIQKSFSKLLGHVLNHHFSKWEPSHATHLCRPCSWGCHKEPRAARGCKQGSSQKTEGPTEKHREQPWLLIPPSPWLQPSVHTHREATRYRRKRTKQKATCLYLALRWTLFPLHGWRHWEARGDTTSLMSAEAFGSQFSASSTTPQTILSLVHCVALAKSLPLSGLHCTDAKPIHLGSPRSLLRMLVQESGKQTLLFSRGAQVPDEHSKCLPHPLHLQSTRHKLLLTALEKTGISCHWSF